MPFGAATRGFQGQSHWIHSALPHPRHQAQTCKGKAGGASPLRAKGVLGRKKNSDWSDFFSPLPRRNAEKAVRFLLGERMETPIVPIVRRIHARPGNGKCGAQGTAQPRRINTRSTSPFREGGGAAVNVGCKEIARSVPGPRREEYCGWSSRESPHGPNSEGRHAHPLPVKRKPLPTATRSTPPAALSILKANTPHRHPARRAAPPSRGGESFARFNRHGKSPCLPYIFCPPPRGEEWGARKVSGSGRRSATGGGRRGKERAAWMLRFHGGGDCMESKEQPIFSLISREPGTGRERHNGTPRTG